MRNFRLVIGHSSSFCLREGRKGGARFGPGPQIQKDQAAHGRRQMFS